MQTIKRALISVYDKRNLAYLSGELNALGVEIISTGKTAKKIRELGVPVKEVSSFTGFPEMLGGRIKTLHPKIHAAILFRRGNKQDEEEIKKFSFSPIDMVVVNLYPFVEIAGRESSTEAEIIESIDIGGPTLIRSAAKNFEHVVVVVDPDDYEAVITEMKEKQCTVSFETRRRLMAKAFTRTARYDWNIAKFFSQKKEDFPQFLKMRYERSYNLRYGENPHQKATAYTRWGEICIFDAKIYAGKTMSFNNFLDADAALGLIREFKDDIATIIIKHTNPCGGAIGKTLVESYKKAFQSDPGSAFGSVVAFSRPVDLETAKEIGNRFVDVILAPGYDDDALLVLKQKNNRRILDITNLLYEPAPRLVARNVWGGILYQEYDNIIYDESALRFVTKRKPTKYELAAMKFATKFVKHTKSNAIVFSTDTQLTGVGAGQMSRIDACKIAIQKARRDGFDLSKSVMASDAFIPFPDVIDEIAKEEVKAVIQPGGSIKDKEIVSACDSYGIAMAFTGVRHFRH
ncbi:MAG: bifunctional phosphoribosylaminoimidazolecarboxamide formyltransferase/IMP cyclohydrolase [Candidatus Anstonellales archaeon]